FDSFFTANINSIQNLPPSIRANTRFLKIAAPWPTPNAITFSVNMEFAYATRSSALHLTDANFKRVVIWHQFAVPFNGVMPFSCALKQDQARERLLPYGRITNHAKNSPSLIIESWVDPEVRPIEYCYVRF